MPDQELREIIGEAKDVLKEGELPEIARCTTYHAVGEKAEPSGW